MKKEKCGFYIFVLLIFVLVVYFLYKKYTTFLDSPFFVSLVTFLVGGLAIFLYIKQRNDTKRDSAKIIIQEIRRAEKIIDEYKKKGTYEFAKKIIATNSWSKNIHLFVGYLDNDELDKISELYSTGKYLDCLVQEISEITLKYGVDVEKEKIKFDRNKRDKINNLLFKKHQLEDSDINSNYQEIKKMDQIINRENSLQFVINTLSPVGKNRLDIISNKLQPIYHSTILLKLKKIAKINKNLEDF